MNKIRFNWNKESQITEDFTSAPKKDEFYCIHVYNVPVELKDKIVEILDAEMQNQLIKATKEYEEEQSKRERERQPGFLDRIARVLYTKEEPDIESEEKG